MIRSVAGPTYRLGTVPADRSGWTFVRLSDAPRGRRWC
jgi:hypothetical protein